MNETNDLQIQFHSLKSPASYMVCIHGKDDLGLEFVQGADA